MIRGFFAFVIAVVIGGFFAQSRLHGALRSSEAASVMAIPDFVKKWNGRKPLQAGMNCFGTTSAAFGAGRIPRYVGDKEFMIFLKASCRELDAKEPAVANDVGVIFDGRDLEKEPAHTFLFTKDGGVFYKNGVEAGTAFKLDTLKQMSKEFRVGFSQEKCDQVASTMEETGLPCPSFIKRYRCQQGVMPSWPEMDRAETAVYASALSLRKPTDREITEIQARLREVLADVSMTQAADGTDRAWMRARVESLDSFFGFYIDREAWGVGDVMAMRDLLSKIKAAM